MFCVLKAHTGDGGKKRPKVDQGNESMDQYSLDSSSRDSIHMIAPYVREEQLPKGMHEMKIQDDGSHADKHKVINNTFKIEVI